MDVSTAEWMVGPDAADALAAAEAEPDPDSLSAATRLRSLVSNDRAAAVLDQASLRRRARRRFGDAASVTFWTPTGLEQATRPAVSERRARRFVALLAPQGTGHVVDLTCGCGADAVAFVRAGLRVTAVERDAVTAVLARANLTLQADSGEFLPVVGNKPSTMTPRAPVAQATPAASADPGARATLHPGDMGGLLSDVRPESSRVTPGVLCGDAEDLATALLAPDLLAGSAGSAGTTAVFIDPSRRTAAGRTWRVEDLQPSWGFVTTLLDGSRTACAKLGPGLPHSVIPDSVEAEWVSDHGDLVEASLWAGPGTTPGLRRAVVDGHELTRQTTLAPPPTDPPNDYLYEPDPAVIRAGLVPALAETLNASRVHDQVAYLTAHTPTTTPFATGFRVHDQLPYSEKALKAWVRDHHIGVLEIKKRGIDVDPAALRKRLRPHGPNQATLILTPTASGAVALVVRRLDAG